ncbi:MAG: hypothetical protein FJ144_21710 [Deltaproteobacteria bacterium]|nr:hypothetical protein [Deltaproteobacteria bacterium]
MQANGVQLGPGSMRLHNGANTSAESLTGALWIDLDTIPALIGVPLDVVLECTEETGFGDTSLSATLNVRLVKKK